jgi:cell division protease FtsH
MENKNNINKSKKHTFYVGLAKVNMFWIAFGLGILIFVIYNIFNRPLDAQIISLNKFISKIDNNNYSIVEIRDDNKILAKEKYIYIAEVDKNNLNFSDKKNVKVIYNDQFEEISFDELLKYIKPIDGISDLREYLSNISSFQRISDIYIADDSVIAINSNLNGDDYIIKINQEELLSNLKSQNLSITDLATNVHFLNVAFIESDFDQVEKFYENNLFDKVWFNDNKIYAKLTNKHIKSDLLQIQNGFDLLGLLQKEEISINSETINYKMVPIATIPWGDLLTFIILLGFGGLAFFMFRGIQGSGSSLMKFGQSKARMIFGSKQNVTFKDVAGVDEAKEELQEIVLFLRDPKRFLNKGARIPKGVLMVGSPGTGKTLLARAIAGEAGVPFFHTSGSEFEEMLVGAGASRVRDLFEKAKKASPSIIFIDEIDAVARKRGTTIQSGTTEQTLNQILVEMDGFEKNVNVIVIAATNRPDVLDTAILRPGRFDRRVVIDLPDIEGRKQIIAIHAKNKPISKTVDLERLARRTVGFSGADIENMLNEAAIIVAKSGKAEIEYEDLEEATNKVQIGPAKKRKRSQKELRMTAYHEAGHALVMKMVPEHDPVHRVTIVSRGMALGYTMPLPETDQVQMSKIKMLSKITALVAGFATEELVFGDVTSGASNDIEKASSIARNMVKNFGMSKKLGLVKYGQEQDLVHLGHSYGEEKNYSDATANLIDEEVRGIISKCYDEAKNILSQNRQILDNIVEALLDKEVLDNNEFEAFFEKK